MDIIGTLQTVLVFVFVIGFLVFIHELGHFWAARIVGIRVEEFSIGMGPKIWGFRSSNTDFNLRLLPIGGFVKMYGEGDYDILDKDSYGGKNPYQRLLVLLAGVFMNFLFAVIFFYIQGFAVDFQYRSFDTVFGENYQTWFGKRDNTLFVILEGDNKFEILLKVNDKDYSGLNELNSLLIQNAGKQVKLTLMNYTSKDVKEIYVNLKAINNNLVGLNYTPLVTIKSVNENSPLKGKIEALESILLINNQKYSFDKFTSIIKENRGKNVTFTVVSADGNSLRDVEVFVPDRDLPLGISYMPSVSVDFLLGTQLAPISLIKFEGLSKLWSGPGHALNNIQAFFYSIDYLIKRSIQARSAAPVVDNVSGIVGVFQILDRMVKFADAWIIFEVMALFSLNFAIINILPIPALDGGHVLFTLIEIIRNKRLNSSFYNKVTYAGFIFLVSLMIFVTLTDLVKFTDARKLFCNENYSVPFLCNLSDFRR